MRKCRGFAIGAIFVLIAALLLAAGCTQPSGSATGTATPTPTVANPSVTVTVTPGVTMNITANATMNTTANVTMNVTALKAELPVLAKKFADQIDGKTFLSAAAEGPDSTAFKTVLDQLKAFKATDTRLIYVYTLEQQNGTLRFVIDANYGLPDGSDYLEDYPDAAIELKNPVTAPLAAGPYTDSYGTFVSGYVPINATKNGSIFVLGIDVRA